MKWLFLFYDQDKYSLESIPCYYLLIRVDVSGKNWQCEDMNYVL